jgi:hypothetical protein
MLKLLKQVIENQLAKLLRQFVCQWALYRQIGFFNRLEALFYHIGRSNGGFSSTVMSS